MFRHRKDVDFSEEIQSHIALEMDRLIDEGWSPENARDEASRRFGNAASARERFYESRRLVWLDQLRQDVRYAVSMFARTPAFSLVVILTLAIGIGANTTIFSIVDGVLLRPLPYKDPQNLVAIWDKGDRDESVSKRFASYRDFEEIKRSATSFAEVAAATWAGSTARVLTGQGRAQEVMVVPVSASFFQLLGVVPMLGRAFADEDRSVGCSVVLSHTFWREVLHSQIGIIGQSIDLDDHACQVLGVMPPGFTFYPGETPIWTLITPAVIPEIGVGIFARLKTGISYERALSEVAAIHSALHQADGKEREVHPILFNLQGEFTWLASRNLRATVWVLFAAVNIVLLIACLNVSSLLLARSLSREREMAVRMALGCGRRRLVRQLLTEALMLSVTGGIAGVAFAFAAIRYFQLVNPVELPAGADIGLRLPVLLFTLAVSVAAAIVFGVVPAWKVSGADVSSSLKAAVRGATGIRTNQRFAAFLVVAEMGLSVVLLAGAGLLMASVLHLGSTPLGFQPDHLLTTHIDLWNTPYLSAGRRVEFYREVEQRLNSLRGIAEAALTSGLPPFGDDIGNTLELEGAAETESPAHDVSSQAISANYFHLMGEPLLYGRPFGAADQTNSEMVAIVNEALAREYFPNRNPVGLKVRYGSSDSWLSIVGVVANEKYSALEEMTWEERPVLFRPLAQDARRRLSIAIRPANGRVDVGGQIQHEIAAMDSSLPIPGTDTLQNQLSRYVLAYPRFRTLVFTAFAGFALLLSAVGLYGLMTCSIHQRRYEIGIRLALGARPAVVRNMVLFQGMRFALIGLSTGTLCALGLTRLIAGFLYGVRASDPIVFAVAPLVLGVVMLLAVWIPARRAVRIDPMNALRGE